jgi:hypothetical protein
MICPLIARETKPATYDQSGQVDYVDLFNKASDDYGRLVVDAGVCIGS